MARKDSKKLAIVGAGHMAEGALATCNEVFQLVGGARLEPQPGDARPFRARSSSRNSRIFEIRPSTNLEETVRGADVVVTLTPARGPIVMAEWVAPGHAHRRGRRRQEGRPGARRQVLNRARIFVDDIRQCRTDGEINVPLSEG